MYACWHTCMQSSNSCKYSMEILFRDYMTYHVLFFASHLTGDWWWILLFVVIISCLYFNTLGCTCGKGIIFPSPELSFLLLWTHLFIWTYCQTQWQGGTKCCSVHSFSSLLSSPFGSLLSSSVSSLLSFLSFSNHFLKVNDPFLCTVWERGWRLKLCTLIGASEVP